MPSDMPKNVHRVWFYNGESCLMFWSGQGWHRLEGQPLIHDEIDYSKPPEPIDIATLTAEKEAAEKRAELLDKKLRAIADEKLVEQIDVWWHMENEEVPDLYARLAEAEKDNTSLRELLAITYSGLACIYGDDGELQDASSKPFIDYRRDSVEQIRKSMIQRGMNALTPPDAEVCAILDMIEEGLPKPLADAIEDARRYHEAQFLMLPEAAAIFLPQYIHHVEAIIKAASTITGPDSEDKARAGVTKIIGKMSGPEFDELEYDPDNVAFKPAPNPGTPCITFKPWVQKKCVPLKDAPPNKPHRCEDPYGLAKHVMHDGENVYHVYSGGERARIIGPLSSGWFALDVPPPPPKTLADVPEGVVIEDKHGQLIYRIGDTPVKFMGLPDQNYPPSDYDVARVLGTPIFNAGGSDEQG